MPTVVIRNRNKVPIPCSSWSNTSIMAKPLSKAMSIDTHIRRLVVITHRTLHWRHNDHDGVWNYQPHGCLVNRLFRRRSKKTSKLRVTGLCEGFHRWQVNSPHKGPYRGKCFHLMTSSWAASSPRLLLRSQGFAFQVAYNFNTGFSFEPSVTYMSNSEQIILQHMLYKIQILRDIVMCWSFYLHYRK